MEPQRIWSFVFHPLHQTAPLPTLLGDKDKGQSFDPEDLECGWEVAWAATAGAIKDPRIRARKKDLGGPCRGTQRWQSLPAPTRSGPQGWNAWGEVTRLPVRSQVERLAPWTPDTNSPEGLKDRGGEMGRAEWDVLGLLLPAPGTQST